MVSQLLVQSVNFSLILVTALVENNYVLYHCLDVKMTHRIQSGWKNWKKVSGILMNKARQERLRLLPSHIPPEDAMKNLSNYTVKSIGEVDPKHCDKLWGNDCFVANIILAMNKLRYKDGKRDPMGFKSFLSEQLLGKGFIPRYRGNRLHVIFHICGKYFAHHDAFLTYLSSGLTLGGLRAVLLQDFGNETAIVEMQVLGLFGKRLTGMWTRLLVRIPRMMRHKVFFDNWFNARVAGGPMETGNRLCWHGNRLR